MCFMIVEVTLPSVIIMISKDKTKSLKEVVINTVKILIFYFNVYLFFGLSENF